jgi:hypothetical protein
VKADAWHSPIWPHEGFEPFPCRRIGRTRHDLAGLFVTDANQSPRFLGIIVIGGLGAPQLGVEKVKTGVVCNERRIADEW